MSFSCVEIKGKVRLTAGLKHLCAHSNIKGCFDHGFGQDLMRRAKSHCSAVDKHQNIISIFSCKIQIVQAGDNGQVQLSDHLQNLQLVADIQMVCWLVQDQNFRLLCQSTRYHYPLALATRQGAEHARSQIAQVQPVQRAFDDFAILSRG